MRRSLVAILLSVVACVPTAPSVGEGEGESSEGEGDAGEGEGEVAEVRATVSPSWQDPNTSFEQLPTCGLCRGSRTRLRCWSATTLSSLMI
jgi:hypothetical protein